MEAFDNKVKALCLKLYDIGVLKFGDFKMKVGMNSPVYIDLRLLISYPAVMSQLSELMIEFIKHKKLQPKLLCGVPYNALIIATVLSVQANIPMVVRRKERKSYGTMKLIEGKYNEGDECLIFEDVVTTGSSILETFHDLKNDGLIVKEAVVVFDREQGGRNNLKNHGLIMHSLLDFSKIFEILKSENKITEETIKKVKIYLSEHQISPTGDPLVNITSRLTLSYGNRSDTAKCLVARQLFQLMESKGSNLCIAVDVTTKEELLTLVKQVGEFAAVIKTHSDIVKDWDDDLEQQLQALATQHSFFIMEDRKFGDIGQTVKFQCEKVFKWANLITMHSVAGIGSLMGAAEAAAASSPKGIFLVAQLSTKSNLITPQYSKATMELAKEQAGLIAGMVCQVSDIISDPGFIQMTPGVSMSSVGDNFGQQYVGLEEAVLVKGADLIVIGRAITQNTDPAEQARKAKEALWQAYSNRISSS